jgi:hypothetical protein
VRTQRIVVLQTKVTIMIRTSIAIVSLAALAIACTPPAAKKDTAAAPEKVESQAEIDAGSHDGPVGWMAADEAGMPGVIYRAGVNAQNFKLMCGEEQQMLYVTAEAPVELKEPNMKAVVMLDDAKFDGVVDVSTGDYSVEVNVPLTPQVMKALGAASSAKLKIGEGVTETDTAGGVELKAFASRCVTFTKIKPAP